MLPKYCHGADGSLELCGSIVSLFAFDFEDDYDISCFISPDDSQSPLE